MPSEAYLARTGRSNGASLNSRELPGCCRRYGILLGGSGTGGSSTGPPSAAVTGSPAVPLVEDDGMREARLRSSSKTMRDR